MTLFQCLGLGCSPLKYHGGWLLVLFFQRSYHFPPQPWCHLEIPQPFPPVNSLMLSSTAQYHPTVSQQTTFAFLAAKAVITLLRPSPFPLGPSLSLK